MAKRNTSESAVRSAQRLPCFAAGLVFALEITQEFVHSIDLNRVARLAQASEAKGAEGAFDACVGGALHIRPAIADHPIV